MWKTYKEKNIPYSLRRGISLSIPNVNTRKYGISSLNFGGSVFVEEPINKVKKNVNFYKDLSCCYSKVKLTYSACKA